ncbi:unnamed protein product, partial [Prorocentrum cordatum]
ERGNWLLDADIFSPNAYVRKAMGEFKESQERSGQQGAAPAPAGPAEEGASRARLPPGGFEELLLSSDQEGKPESEESNVEEDEEANDEVADSAPPSSALEAAALSRGRPFADIEGAPGPGPPGSKQWATPVAQQEAPSTRDDAQAAQPIPAEAPRDDAQLIPARDDGRNASPIPQRQADLQEAAPTGPAREGASRASGSLPPSGHAEHEEGKPESEEREEEDDVAKDEVADSAPAPPSSALEAAALSRARSSADVEGALGALGPPGSKLEATSVTWQEAPRDGDQPVPAEAPRDDAQPIPARDGGRS